MKSSASVATETECTTVGITGVVETDGCEVFDDASTGRDDGRTGGGCCVVGGGV